jgi:hypothetical protein
MPPTKSSVAPEISGATDGIVWRVSIFLSQWDVITRGGFVELPPGAETAVGGSTDLTAANTQARSQRAGWLRAEVRPTIKFVGSNTKKPGPFQHRFVFDLASSGKSWNP